MSAPIQSRARAYEETGIRPADALHLAAAVEAGADAFCTTDDPLHQRGREADTGATAVCTPIELIARIES